VLASAHLGEHGHDAYQQLLTTGVKVVVDEVERVE
jgi:hypothetical protein